MSNKNKKTKKVYKHVTPQKRRQIEKKRSQTAANFLFSFVLVAFCICLVSVLHIEITDTFRGKDLEAYRDSRYTLEDQKLARRGTIYDRYNNPIATDVKEYKLKFYLSDSRGDGEYVTEPEQTTNQLVEILGYSDDQEAYDYILDKLTTDGELYQTYIGKYGEHVSLAQKEELEAAQIAGIDYEEGMDRYYPYGDFASYSIGYTSTEEVETDGEIENVVTGHLGIEEQQNGYLSSSNGKTEKKVDNAGVSIEESLATPHTDGMNVVSTIDPQIQTILQTNMEKQLDGLEYEQAISIITDAKTQEILATYTSPSFDPNKRDITNYVDPYTTYCFEPGSTIKSFTVATAMEEGVYNPNNTNATGRRTDERWGEGEEISDYIYNLNEGMSWGTITWDKGYYFSSNVIMTYILDAIGYETFADYMTDEYLFGQAIDNEYMQTSSCSYSPKYALDYANTSFGQGMTTNVLQLAQAYSIFANDGDMKVPHYVKQTIDPTTGEVKYDSANDKDLVVKNVISKETADTVLDMMYDAVYYDENTGSTLNQGTGYRYGEGKTKVIGKSGTAQIYDEVSGYDFDNLANSFAGFAPAEDPEIFMYTIVFKGGDGVSDAMGRYYTNTVDETMLYLHGENEQQIDETVTESKKTMLKDYTGTSLETAQKKLSEEGYTTYVIGSGDVNSQYPEPNQNVSVDQVIYLAGTGDYNPDAFVTMQTTAAQDICFVLNYTCSFDGIGKVTSVEVIDNDTFNFTTEEPSNITTFDSSVTTRKSLTDVTTNKKGD